MVQQECSKEVHYPGLKKTDGPTQGVPSTWRSLCDSVLVPFANPQLTNKTRLLLYRGRVDCTRTSPRTGDQCTTHSVQNAIPKKGRHEEICQKILEAKIRHAGLSKPSAPPHLFTPRSFANMRCNVHLRSILIIPFVSQKSLTRIQGCFLDLSHVPHQLTRADAWSTPQRLFPLQILQPLPVRSPRLSPKTTAPVFDFVGFLK